METGAMGIRAGIRRVLGRGWPATRLAIRLGIIAATLTGVALAFNLGGRDGYVVPLTALLGAPSNGLVFYVLGHLFQMPHSLIASAGQRAQWDMWHLIYCATIAVNWGLAGVAVDVCSTRPEEPPPDSLSDVGLQALPEADELNMAFEELERRVREREDEPRQHFPRRAA